MRAKLPLHDSEVELTERKSRFIGNVFVVYSEKEAREALSLVEASHPRASHVVYAYDISPENAVRVSDAGEPKGTAGMPVYEVFRREGLTYYICTVTRYFGGILLGAGGLIRAYAGTAKMALDAAGTATLEKYDKIRVTCDYSHFDIIRAFLKNYECKTESTDFAERVTLIITAASSSSPDIIAGIKEKTSARAQTEITGFVMKPVAIK